MTDVVNFAESSSKDNSQFDGWFIVSLFWFNGRFVLLATSSNPELIINDVFGMTALNPLSKKK